MTIIAIFSSYKNIFATLVHIFDKLRTEYYWCFAKKIGRRKEELAILLWWRVFPFWLEFRVRVSGPVLPHLPWRLSRLTRPSCRRRRHWCTTRPYCSPRRWVSWTGPRTSRRPPWPATPSRPGSTATLWSTTWSWWEGWHWDWHFNISFHCCIECRNVGFRSSQSERLEIIKLGFSLPEKCWGSTDRILAKLNVWKVFLYH